MAIINPFPHYNGFTQFTPVVPELYWNVYSQEERIKALCMEYVKLTEFTDSMVDTLNNQYAIIEDMQARFPQLVNDDVIAEIRRLVDAGEFDDILQAEADRFLEEKTAQVTANTNAINEINNVTIPGINEAIQTETTAREEAIQAETTARNEAIQAETTAREEAEDEIKNSIYANYSKTKIQVAPTVPADLEVLGVDTFSRYPTFYWNADKTEACIIGNLQYAGTSYPATAFNVTIPLNQQAKPTGTAYQISNPSTYFANVDAGRWEIGTTQFLVDEDGWISITLTMIRKPAYDADNNWQYRVPFTGNIYLFDGVGR